MELAFNDGLLPPYLTMRGALVEHGFAPDKITMIIAYYAAVIDTLKHGKTSKARLKNLLGIDVSEQLDALMRCRLLGRDGRKFKHIIDGGENRFGLEEWLIKKSLPENTMTDMAQIVEDQFYERLEYKPDLLSFICLVASEKRGLVEKVKL